MYRQLILSSWVLILLHSPNGQPLLIAHDGIEVIRPSDECHWPAKTEIRAATGTYCVRETVESIKKQIEDADANANAVREAE